MRYLTRPPAPTSSMQVARDEELETVQEFEDGGRVGFKLGTDPEKIKRIEELVREGKYNKTEISRILQEEGYGGVQRKRDDLIVKTAKDLKMKLPTGFSKEELAARQASGKYLTFYDNEKLEADLKKGKLAQDIGEDLYKNNKKYYNKIGVTEKDMPKLNAAIQSKINKSENLKKLNEDNTKKYIKQQKQVLKDVDLFIENNKQKYLKLYSDNKLGVPFQFKEDLINFIEKKHPNFIKTTEYTPTSSRSLPKGSKVLDLPDLYERTVTQGGDYGRDVFLKKKIRESLGIPERASPGEGLSESRLQKNYNATIKELLSKAQQEGAVPKTFTTKTGVIVPINSVNAYFRYARQLGIDPINALFEYQVKFGVEHVGGIARAGKIGDYKTLDKVLAFDSYVNKYVKGSSFDSRMTTLIELAKQAEPTKAKQYIKTVNDMVAKAEKQYGIPLTKYKIVKDKVVAFHPNISLTDSTFKKAKVAINHFITNDGLNHPNFQKLDSDLQKTITDYSEGKIKEADTSLKKVLKQKGLSSEIIPGMRGIIDSSLPTAFKVLGGAGLGLGIYGAGEMYEEGAPIADALIEGGLGVPGPVRATAKYSWDKKNLTPDEKLAIQRRSLIQTIDAGEADPEFLTARKQLDPDFKDKSNQEYVDFLTDNKGNIFYEADQSDERFDKEVYEPFLEKKLETRYTLSDIPIVQKLKSEFEKFDPNSFPFNILKYDPLDAEKITEKDQNLPDLSTSEGIGPITAPPVENKPRVNLEPISFPSPTFDETMVMAANGGRINFQEGSEEKTEFSEIPEYKENKPAGGIYFGVLERRKPIVATSGGEKEAKQFLSSLITDQKPAIGYGGDNFSMYAARSLNPYDKDKTMYEGIYNINPDSRFFVQKQGGYTGAGVEYDRENIKSSIRLSKDEMDERIMFNIGAKFSKGGVVD